MANVIKHKRGSGSDPVASDLVVGEVAIRTDVGKLFTKMDNGTVAEIAGGGSDIAINTLSSSSGTGGGSATFNGSAYRFTLSAPPSVSAQQLLVSINGVIQKPVAGTGQPSEGFSVDGTDIILGDAPATGSDFFILTFKSLGVSEPADNSVTSAKIVDGAIVNADINASAAIAGSKLNPVGLSSVGIGTTSPARDLSLHSGDASSIFAHFTNTDTGTTATDGCIIGLGGSEDLVLNNQETGKNIIFENGGSERMRIDSSGRLLLGVTSDSRTTSMIIQGNSFGASQAMLNMDSATTSISDGTNLGIIRFGTLGDRRGADIRGLGDGTWSAGSSHPTRLGFYTNSNSAGTPTERMRIDSSGNVGIGKTSPSHRLDISQDGGTFPSAAGSTVLRLSNSSGSATLSIDANASSVSAVQFGDTSAASQGTLLYNHSSNHMQFNTSGSERMRIKNDGDILLTRPTAGSGANETLEITANYGAGSDQAVVASNNLRIYTDGNNERIRIDTSGNVGIGTTSPATRLHIEDTTPDLRIKSTNANLGQSDEVGRISIHTSDPTTPTGVGEVFRIKSFSANANGADYSTELVSRAGSGGGESAIRLGQGAVGAIAFRTNTSGSATERMRIDSSGNVGIALTPDSGQGILQINGGLRIAGSASASDTSAPYIFRSSGANNMVFATGNSERMRIDTSGRLLINTTNNSNGHISASNLAVQGADLSIFKDSGGDNSGVSGHKLKFVTQSGSLGEIDVLSEGGGGPNGRGGAMRFYTKANNTGSASERVRITQDGNIKYYRFNTLFGNEGLELYNTTSGGPQLQISRASGNPLLLNRNTSDGQIVEFRRGWGAGGSIDVGTNSCTYNTSSDYRLKENIVPISDGITRLKTLKPSRFNWIGDTSSTRDGFIAHEVTAVPEAITGTKDEVYTEDQPNINIKAGDPKYQGIDQSKLVPLLVAALQEAVSRIEALEAK